MKKIKSFTFSSRNNSVKSFNGRANIDAMYDHDWMKYSLDFLKENPKCYSCGRDSEVTDHIKAHKGDIKLFWKLDNCLPLCHSCHNTITSLFDRFPVQKYQEKLKWLSKNRGINGLTFKVRALPIPKSVVVKLSSSENRE
jgi:5-methylcytosine-specific restriction endonuclease McrA